jgi:hypothetical protein
VLWAQLYTMFAASIVAASYRLPCGMTRLLVRLTICLDTEKPSQGVIL